MQASGTSYDVAAPIGQIAESVAPIEGEAVIVKNYPSAFEKTALDAALKKPGVKIIVYAGFMTHMCVNSTTRALFQSWLCQHSGGGSHGDTVDPKLGERQGRVRGTTSGR
jgi:nicotinamidase-related amidase